MTTNFLTSPRAATALATLALLLGACTDLELSPEFPDDQPSLNISATTSLYSECESCSYVVPEGKHVIDGSALGLGPGSVIGLSADVAYGHLIFRNIVGSADAPIIIKNCGGVANVAAPGMAYTIKTENSKHFRITGGNTAFNYGIRITGGRMGITLDKLSTNFEVDHVEVYDVGFAGIMAKTDPSCDDATIRGNFVMRNVYFHNNYIHECGGEGFYVGNSFYQHGMNTACGVRLPHEIHVVKIYNNIIRNSGWDGIQLGCATRAAKVYGNTIENYGTANVKHQNNGIQIGAGTGGFCYGNHIKGGTGNGLIVMGLGNNVVHNNVIANAGDLGIFCDERYTPGPGFKFINNTILNPKSDGIRIYADLVPMNVIINNLIVNPGSYASYTYPRKPQDAFVYTLSSNVKIHMANNLFTTDAMSIQFIDAAGENYRVSSSSPVIDQGADISAYYINTDYYKKARFRGNGYDIGATEHQQ